MINLGWPPKELNPNSRTHWAVKARFTKKYRSDAFWLAMESKTKAPEDGNIDVHIIFNPPDKRKRDMDGMLSSIKAGLDGVADAWGVNDGRFRIHLEIGAAVKGGCVLIKLGVK